MAKEDKDLKLVPKLNKTNYRMWSNMITLKLSGRPEWQYILGLEHNRPSQTKQPKLLMDRSNAKEVEDWMTDNAKWIKLNSSACWSIRKTLSMKIQVESQEISVAGDLWQWLSTTYGKTNKFHAIRRGLRLTQSFDPGKNLDSFLSNFKSIHEEWLRLRISGSDILAVALIDSLAPYYESWAVMTEARLADRPANEPLSPDELVASIRNFVSLHQGRLISRKPHIKEQDY